MTIISIHEARKYISQIDSPVVKSILFGGDRISCCDEAAVIVNQNNLIAIATIAPHGEMNSGYPTIVGVYVMLGYREQGYGKKVTQDAIDRCVDRTLIPVHVDALTPAMKKICDGISPRLISVNDFSQFPVFFD